ncbi:hypothetical protein E2C01_096598 [Portunus trituberculatus]|uniref:Uncharacterized protein n=1 Tax=Portunus trituberculatus TaxID=210409 RepID=A0A5B7K2F8_PORTR|nr:hypothetical protein [Portunus trituberculatus]
MVLLVNNTFPPLCSRVAASPHKIHVLLKEPLRCSSLTISDEVHECLNVLIGSFQAGKESRQLLWLSHHRHRADLLQAPAVLHDLKLCRASFLSVAVKKAQHDTVHHMKEPGGALQHPVVQQSTVQHVGCSSPGHSEAACSMLGCSLDSGGAAPTHTTCSTSYCRSAGRGEGGGEYCSWAASGSQGDSGGKICKSFLKAERK